MRTTLSILLWELGLYCNSRRSREEILRRNQRRFTRLVSHVSRHSPYYARIIRERGLDPRRARPEDFPPLFKTDLIRHFDDIVTVPGLSRQRIDEFLGRSRNPSDLLDGRFVIVHSSGSSGQVVVCAYTLREWVQGWTSLFRVVPVFGPLPRKTAFVGATRGHFASVSLAQTIHWLKIGVFHRSRLFDINEPWAKVIDGLNDFQPHSLSCYGSILTALTFAQERQELRVRPRNILCGGDPLSTKDRERAEQVFGVPVFNIYAATETLTMGLEEPNSEGLVLLEDDLWIEVCDDQLLVTNLRNRTTPLIRYAISDLIVPSAETEFRYYRGFRRVETFAGRKEDDLVLTNEAGQADFIHPLLIVEFYVAGIDRFQVRRTSSTSFSFCVKAQPSLSAHEREVMAQEIYAKWTELLAQKNMRNVRFDVQFVDNLHNDPHTGKFRLVDSCPTSAKFAA